MVEVRALQVGELAAAAALADATFRDEEQFSMAQAFPNIFSHSLREQSYGAFDDGKLVSFMGVVPTVVHVGDARLNVFSIGAVCTHPDYRGYGLASDVLAKAMAHIDRADGALMLVSGTRSLYTRIGCHLFGAVTRFVLKPTHARSLLAEAPTGVVIRELEPADWLKLAALAAARPVRFEQSVWDLAALIDAEAYASCIKLAHKVLVAEENGQLRGFLVASVPYANGSKRPPHAFEWAGDAETIRLLAAAAVDRYALTELEIPVSWFETALLERLQQPFAEKKEQQEQNLGTVKVIQAERLLAQLRPYLRARDAEVSEQLTVRQLANGDTVVSVADASTQLTPQGFISLLFDPEPNFGVDVDVQLQAQLKRLFPIPFPYSAGLNYV